MYHRCMLLLLTIFILACTSENQDAANQSALPVKTVRVVKKAIPSTIITSGILVSGDEMRLSFKVGGIIKSISVREGQTVKRDQVLASLNLSEIKAQVSLARNNYEKTLRDLSRIENLFQDSVATLEQRQNAKTAVDVAYSNVQIAEFNLKHAVIRAPVDGIILKKFVEKNEITAPGQPVFFFGSSGSRWRVKVGITERDFVKLNLHDSAYVSFDAYPGMEFKASIIELAGSADPITGTFEAEIQVEPTDYRLISGFIARVKIISSQRDVYYIIPIEALYEADGSHGSVFYIPVKGGNVKKQQVELGPVFGNNIAVRSGLEHIDYVISAGTAYLYDGAAVRIVGQEL
jgi:multidrug efflux system membrane fusion protein